MENRIVITSLFGQDEILKALHSIGSSLFNQTVNTTEALERLSCKYCKSANVIALSEENRIIGLCAFYDNDEKDKTAFLSMLVIDQKVQGKGYGNLLLQKMLERCEQSKMERVLLEVSASNEKAQHFYQKHGFVEERNSKKTVYRFEF